MATVAGINDQRRVHGTREPSEQPEPVFGSGEEDTAALRLKAALEAFIGQLDREAMDRISARQTIEDRMIEDLRHYYGRYDPSEEKDLKAKKKSRLYVKLSRMKTHGWEARLADMLFPTDEKNWGIGPTPVPELEDAIIQEPGSDKATGAMDILAEAKKRAKGMEKTIDDQFTECQYNIKARQAIHDACKLGSGIMKGPLVSNRMKRRWEQKGNVYTLIEIPDEQPEFVRTNPFDFFPDMSAMTVEEGEGTFERHRYVAKDLRKLAKQPGFDKKAINELLKEGPQQEQPPFVQQLRDITEVTSVAMKQQFWVWEYHGPIEHDDLATLIEATGNEKLRNSFEDDYLTEFNVILWFCQGKLLKVGPHPLDSNESLYSVFAFEKDDASPFGLGVPYLMRDSQDALNGAWRMMMDNGGLSVGPQIVIDRSQVEPADGNWDFTPRKVWLRKPNATPVHNKPFETFDIPNRQAELTNLIGLSKQFADDETNFPLVAAGESGAHQTTTAQGMAILMNSTNVVFRRVVRNFDDQMTVPNVRRSYDWNMQFNKDQSIKGDFNVAARGSSVLLVREIQAQNLMAMALNFSAHPVLGPITKVAQLYRKLVQAHMLNADDIVKSDTEIAADQEKARQNPQPDPDLIKLQTQEKLAQMKGQTDLQIAQLNRDTEMMKVAQMHNMTIDQLQASLAKAQMDNSTKERLFAAEAAIKERQGSGI